MDLIDAAEAIREKLIGHRISRSANLWSTILKQIRKQDSFDGEYVDTILGIIRSFLSQLDDETANGLWRTSHADPTNQDDAEQTGDVESKLGHDRIVQEKST
jgi:hypothetical protein